MKKPVTEMDRRHLLRATGALSVLGCAAPFALQLAAATSAASQTNDYKALVCIFLFGGNDSHNTLLATDADSWGRYFAARNTGGDPIALMPVGTPPTPLGQTNPVTGRGAGQFTPEAWGGVLPITPNTANPVPAGTNAAARTFAIHPFMGGVQNVFNAGRLAFLANVGTLIAPTTKAQFSQSTHPKPANLFSHNDQTSTWAAGGTEGTRSGWGGKFADMLASMNGSNSLFTAISTAGNQVFLAGQNVSQYILSTGAQPAITINAANASNLLGSTVAPARLRDIITDTTHANLFQADYATVVNRSRDSAVALNSAFAQTAVTSVPAPPQFVNPATGANEANNLATQLMAVARMIAAKDTLGLRRQVFFVSLGGWDHHDFQNRNQSVLLARLSHGLSYFDSVLANINGQDMRNSVTAFTASDFNRTWTTNGDGTDHSWGGHHIIMGGAVRGKDIYGQFPTVGHDIGGFTNPHFIGTHSIPTTSVDQYAATLGRWFGVSDSNMSTIFPNIGNFNTRYLGFLP